MASLADDTEIQIPDDEPAPSVEVTPSPEAAAPKARIIEPDEGIEKLQQQLADEQKAREAESRRRQAAEVDAERSRQEAAKARTETADSQLSLVNTAITSVTQSIDSQEAAYAAALAAGDHAAAAKINREMGANQAKLQRLEAGKEAMERAPKVAPPARVSAPDPVEAFASQLSPRSAAWIREHPECVTDDSLHDMMLSAHRLALRRGMKADTDDYFDFIRNKLDLEQPARVSDDPPPPPVPSPRRAAPAAAPVSRSGNGAGERKNVVRLSAEEVEMAALMKLTPEEYARNKLDLKREGKLN